MSPQAAGKGGGLKAKHLGVPLWGWLGLGAGAVVLFLYIKHRGSAAVTAPPLDSGAATDSLPADLNAPALGGTPSGSSLPDGGGAGGLTATDLQSALGAALQQITDALSTGAVASGGVGGGSTGDNSGGGSTGNSAGADGGSSPAAPGAPGFWWGGKFYGTGGLSFAKFKASEVSHGGKVNQVFLAQHPAIEKAFHLPVLPPPPHQAPRTAGDRRRPPRRPARRPVARHN